MVHNRFCPQVLRLSAFDFAQIKEIRNGAANWLDIPGGGDHAPLAGKPRTVIQAVCRQIVFGRSESVKVGLRNLTMTGFDDGRGM